MAWARSRAARPNLASSRSRTRWPAELADVHHLLPYSGLHIIGEHFAPVHHHLLALPGVAIEDIRTVRSHVHALGQCRALIRELGVTPIVAADTAGAAAELAKSGDRQTAVIALGSWPAGSTASPRCGRTSRTRRTTRPDSSCCRARRASRRPAAASASPASPSGVPQRPGPRSTRRWAASPPTAST